MNASAASLQHPEAIELSREQEQQLLSAAAQMIRATVYGQAATP